MPSHYGEPPHAPGTMPGTPRRRICLSRLLLMPPLCPPLGPRAHRWAPRPAPPHRYPARTLTSATSAAKPPPPAESSCIPWPKRPPSRQAPSNSRRLASAARQLCERSEESNLTFLTLLPASDCYPTPKLSSASPTLQAKNRIFFRRPLPANAALSGPHSGVIRP